MQTTKLNKRANGPKALTQVRTRFDFIGTNCTIFAAVN